MTTLIECMIAIEDCIAAKSTYTEAKWRQDELVEAYVAEYPALDDLLVALMDDATGHLHEVPAFKTALVNRVSRYVPLSAIVEDAMSAGEISIKRAGKSRPHLQVTLTGAAAKSITDDMLEELKNRMMVVDDVRIHRVTLDEEITARRDVAGDPIEDGIDRLDAALAAINLSDQRDGETLRRPASVPEAKSVQTPVASMTCLGSKLSNHTKIPGRKYSYCSVCGKKVGHYANGRLRNHVSPKK